MKAANAVLIKVNQIGTLTETMKAIELAQMNGLETLSLTDLVKQKIRLFLIFQ